MSLPGKTFIVYLFHIIMIFGVFCASYNEENSPTTLENDGGDENDEIELRTLSTVTDTRFQRQIRLAHNDRRIAEAKQHLASDMVKMREHSGLVAIAKRVAARCRFEHSTKAFKEQIDTSFNYVGENIFMSTNVNGEVENIVQAWYKEKQYYDYSTGYCSKTCGHYTQVVWAKSKFLGCAIKKCNSLYFPKTQKTIQNAYLAVCEYGPGGNVNLKTRKPYRRGKLCGTCPSLCIDGTLCWKYIPGVKRGMESDHEDNLDTSVSITETKRDPDVLADLLKQLRQLLRGDDDAMEMKNENADMDTKTKILKA